MEYIKSPQEFIFIPGSLEAIAKLTHAGYRIGIATNQSGLSRGFYNEETLDKIHQKLLTELRTLGGEIHAITYCSHMPDTGCECRKPRPGMLLKLANQFKVDLSEVYFIGDRVSDIEAAYAAGAKPMMVLSPMTDMNALTAYSEVPVYSSLEHVVDQLLLNEQNEA